MTIQWPHNDTKTLFILAPLVALFALGLDLYIPLVPQMGQLFNVSPELMQLTLSGFMFCCAISQIIAGPICDKYGRRPTAIVCLYIFIFGSVLPMIYPSFTTMVIARLIQAIGSSGTFLCAYTTVRDLYPHKSDSAKIYSLINVCISQSPIFAPTIAGIIAQHLHWKVVFGFILIIGCSTLISTQINYHETVPKKHPIHFHHLKTSYYHVIRNKSFQTYTLCASTGMSAFFMFFSQSPYIIMTILGYSKTMFGVFFGIVGLSFLIASLLTHHACSTIGHHRTVEIGTILMAIGSLAICAFNQLFGPTILGLIGPMILVVFGAAPCIGAGLAGTMQPFGSIAGTAFSAVGFCKFLMSAILGIVLMSLAVSPFTLGGLILIFSMISYLLCWYNKDILQQQLPSDIIIPSEYE